MKKVYIKWLDHFGHSDSSWTPLEELEDMKTDDYEIQTVGWLHAETEDRYVLVFNISNRGNFSSSMVILKGTVVEFVVLDEGEEPDAVS